MNTSKFMIALLMTFVCCLLNNAPLYAGHVTSDPTDDGSQNIFIAQDGKITFAAKSDTTNGTVTIDPSSNFGPDGTPSNYTGVGGTGTGTVVVTYDDNATGKEEDCKLFIDHTDPNNKTCSSIASPAVKFKVFVPELTTTTVNSSTQPSSRIKIGIGEEVNCALSPVSMPNPSSIIWTNTGSGSFENNSYSGLQLTYQAYCVAESDTIKITFPNGFVLNTTTFNVILPTQYNLSQESGVAGYTDYTSFVDLGVGFRAYVYFGPDTVNFYNAWWQEKEVQSTCTGSLVGSNLDGVGHHPNPNPIALGTNVRANFGTGIDGGAYDTCSAALVLASVTLPMTNGSTFEWDIPEEADWNRYSSTSGSGILTTFETEPQKGVITTANTGNPTNSANPPIAEMTLSKGDSPDSVHASSSWSRNF